MNLAAVTTPQIVAAAIFAIALLHTFSTKFFAKLAHRDTAHAGFWHLLAEVEVVFGFWAMVLVLALAAMQGKDAAVKYVDTRNFTEPMFVFVVMVVAASRPILQGVMRLVGALAALAGSAKGLIYFWLCLSVVPLFGSFITEPAAMTLAALLLRDAFFSNKLPERLKYATIGTLFVNISIGGTLTNFAAPPVLMVAAKWEWSTLFMLQNFGWRAAIAVFINATVLTIIFRNVIRERARVDRAVDTDRPVPLLVIAIHFLFLAGVVYFAHHPAVFMALFLFFLGFTTAYSRYQDRLLLKEGLLVAFFLGGLVVLGGMQQWWLQPLLSDAAPTLLFYVATFLTAITDNAALTYLGSLVEGLSPQAKYALVAGAVTGGGLTVIANAPNPAGQAILKSYFKDDAVSPLNLLLAAALPTIVSIICFWYI